MRDLVEGAELEDRACPLGCDAGDDFVVEGRDRLHGLAGQFSVVSCRHCGLMRTNPRPTAATIGAYYPAEYSPYATTAVSPQQPELPSGWRAKLRRRLGLTSYRVPDLPAGRLLEIGCASGAFLAAMQLKGWIAQGIEFSDAAATQARAHGLAVQTASVELATAPTEAVDLIAAWMVLEHLHEPVRALGRLRQWVKPDGWLIASVPDAGAWERRVFGPRWYALHLPNHLYHFTPRTLAKLLRAADWQVVRVIWLPNANNLIASLDYLANDLQWQWLVSAVHWLRDSRRAGRIRMGLGWLLGVTRQSGRMVIWARPGESRQVPER